MNRPRLNTQSNERLEELGGTTRTLSKGELARKHPIERDREATTDPEKMSAYDFQRHLSPPQLKLTCLLVSTSALGGRGLSTLAVAKAGTSSREPTLDLPPLSPSRLASTPASSSAASAGGGVGLGRNASLETALAPAAIQATRRSAETGRRATRLS